jgi:hypothetical protein
MLSSLLRPNHSQLIRWITTLITLRVLSHIHSWQAYLQPHLTVTLSTRMSLAQLLLPYASPWLAGWHMANILQHAFDFQSYDSYSNYDSNRIPQPPTPQSQTRTSLAPVSNDSGADSTELNGESNRQGSDSADDEELRPRTESKRREQNRAA